MTDTLRWIRVGSGWDAKRERYTYQVRKTDNGWVGRRLCGHFGEKTIWTSPQPTRIEAAKAADELAGAGHTVQVNHGG